MVGEMKTTRLNEKVIKKILAWKVGLHIKCLDV